MYSIEYVENIDVEYFKTQNLFWQVKVTLTHFSVGVKLNFHFFSEYLLTNREKRRRLWTQNQKQWRRNEQCIIAAIFNATCVCSSLENERKRKEIQYRTNGVQIVKKCSSMQKKKHCKYLVFVDDNFASKRWAVVLEFQVSYSSGTHFEWSLISVIIHHSTVNKSTDWYWSSYALAHFA